MTWESIELRRGGGGSSSSAEEVTFFSRDIIIFVEEEEEGVHVEGGSAAPHKNASKIDSPALGF
jgi:hypothetical protein